MTELRCDNKFHGELFPEDGILEVKCRSAFCGAGPGIVVLHRFDIQSGKMVETLKFRDPGKEG